MSNVTNKNHHRLWSVSQNSIHHVVPLILLHLPDTSVVVIIVSSLRAFFLLSTASYYE